MNKKFKEYNGLNLSEINKEILKYWEERDMFRKSIEIREGKPTFVFYEGPPSANGMPGIHHVMARTIKDVFCRYKTMQGYQVQRKAGWDTHGLPVELSVEKSLGITKEDIGKTISVEEYNDACRRDVMKYTKEWEDLTNKMGYWVDMDDPYVTYDNRYIESLWWLLKQLYEKDLLYKGYTIQPYSPAAGTGLSTHELNQPGCYRDVRDTTATVQFKLKKADSLNAILAPVAERSRSVGDLSTYFLAWTTTPWTLPSNTALAVGAKIDYVLVKATNPYSEETCNYILAEALLDSVMGKVEYEVLATFKGKELEGIEYEQLIPWVNPGEGAFRVIVGDFVTTEDGTGIVHIAPTFGADDDRVAKENGVPPLILFDKEGHRRPMVDLTGKFYKIENLDPDFVKERVNTELYKDFAGRFVKNEYDETLTDQDETLDVALAVMLKMEGKAFKIERNLHNYPHCWRTDKPVLYYPLDSWFIKTTAVRDEMIELNNTINWKPQSTGTGRFGKWLENLQDWNLSRSRYWGTPLPIWRTEDGTEEICIGSTEELMSEIKKSIAAGLMDENPYKDFVPGDYSAENYDPKIIDLHRPFVDNIILVSPSGKMMKRELDLIDVWFDSGAMPFAQLHYPFSPLVDGLEGFYPADFISEGVDQTRGWFFTLHAISTMVQGSVAFKNVISNGLVLDKAGNKMSKRLGNAVDPFVTIEKYGSDPLRWYMMTNASPWDNLKFDVEGVDEVRRKFFGTLYNTYSFFALYANVDNFTNADAEIPMEERPEIDRWIISLLNSLVKEVGEFYEAYEPTRAGRAIAEFVDENLSNWYVRLNRRRYWGGAYDSDKISAYQTLYTCLLTVTKLMAPIAPFYAERLYLDLQEAVDADHKLESVHLEDFPVSDESLIDIYLEECMRLAQQTSSMILALRRKADKKVRQPLAKAVVPAPDEKIFGQINYIADLIKAEVNIKELEVIPADAEMEGVVKKIKPNFKTLGKKYGRQMKEIAVAMPKMGRNDIAEIERQGAYTLALSSGDVLLTSEDVEIFTEDMPGWLVANEGNLTVALDIEVSETLLREGIARELVNRIQNLRKSNDYDITDKIYVTIEKNGVTDAAVEDFSDYIAQQVLAHHILLEDKLEEGTNLDLDGVQVRVQITR